MTGDRPQPHRLLLVGGLFLLAPLIGEYLFGNIAIIGILRLALPTPDAALIIIQVAFAGAIEFDRKRLFFFATLFDSRILFMTLEGGMGLLLAWGDDPSFVFSVGGFHPRFTPPPLPFPTPDRLATYGPSGSR